MEYGFYFDITKCCGCYACAVACMDQNDIAVEGKSSTVNAFRRVFKSETGLYPETRIQYVSLACMHCEDAPCAMSCPTGAIVKDHQSGAVLVKEEACIGCHSCAMACPFGIPRFAQDGKMQKCHMCLIRVKSGFDNPCVRACPTEALTFGPMNEASEEKGKKAVKKLFAGFTGSV